MTITPANRFQETFGVPKGRAATKVVDHLEEYVRAFIEQAPFAVMATADADGHCDASPKGGIPGFVKVLDDRHLLLPDVRGNNLFQSYENVDANAHVGLIFFIPGLAGTVRVNGRAEVVDAAGLAQRGLSLEVFDPDDNAALQQGLLVEVEEAYSHCPRALTFSRLWDTETIEANRAEPPVRR
jgi:PPOX class probable FMN-dependent enzyme